MYPAIHLRFIGISVYRSYLNKSCFKNRHASVVHLNITEFLVLYLIGNYLLIVKEL